MRLSLSGLINDFLERSVGLRIQPASETRLSIARSQVLEISKCDTVIDVGANVGQWAIRLRKNGFKGQIVSYEPSPAFQELAENAKRDELWEVRNTAIADFVGTSRYFLASNRNLSSSMLKPKEILKQDLAINFPVKTEVPVTCLDTEVFETNRLYLKIDAQGAEYSILKGAKKVLKKVLAVEFESSLLDLYEGERNHYTISNFLLDCGFEPEQVVITHWDNNFRTISLDAICTRVTHDIQ